MNIRKFVQLTVVALLFVTSIVSAGSVRAWSQCPTYLTVQWGDTLSGIAALCGTTVDAIRAANPGLGWWLYAGQTLYIPTGTTPPVYPPTSGIYVVQRGDTLGKIAARSGTNERSLNNPPIGAVMVVGGGIAGMQSALDLADQGFKEYLVEAQSAIGGHMAQLDKTFPTNDCAMCTISPRQVETGGHPNITLMTDSEVLAVQGQAGDFNVRVRHHPRYIDVEKCVGCGDCSKVCPILIPDTFNEGLAKRRAAYKLYPQAVPNAYAIAKRGIAPCRDACPAGQRAQGYIDLDGARIGRYRIVAPTEWNFHPQGALPAAMLGVHELDSTDLERRTEWLLQALDPCVTYRLIVDHA